MDDFLQNKYTRWYFNIVYNAADIKVVGKTERHHVLPQSMFLEYINLTEHKWNGVHLTHREHFICHWLLSKMVAGRNKFKMLLALQAMQRINKKRKRYSTKITSRAYEKLKIELSQWQSIRMSGKNNSMFGRSAVTEQNLQWFTNGIENVYVTPGKESSGYARGRNVPWNRTRLQPSHLCISPTGETFDSLQDAAFSENTSVNAIRERIRRSENNQSGHKKSGWKFL